MTSGNITCILFDLGNVVVEVHPARIFSALAVGANRDPAVIQRALLADTDWWNQFSTEQFTEEALAIWVNNTLGCHLAPPVVTAAFNAELGPLIQTTVDILPLLSQQVVVGCLSNTNTIHWEALHRNYTVMQQFSYRFASQLIGHAKPSDDIYLHVGELLGCAPEEILFFDDRSENVLAAKKLGWQARHYTTHPQLIADLQGCGIQVR